MRRILSVVIPACMVIVLFALLQASTGVSGAANNITVIIDGQAEIQGDGPPWYSELWHYRRPVTIYNPGIELPYYQVLIRLDNSNFDFNKAKSDGTDLRVTGSSGKNPLTFWIESWDKPNQIAYIWVLTDYLPASSNSAIYLYYGNPEASPVSDEISPFEFFDDDWSQFVGGGCSIGENQKPGHSFPNNPIKDISKPATDANASINGDGTIDGYHIGSVPWVCIGSGPSLQAGMLVLNNQTGIYTSSKYNGKAVGFRANYGSGDGNESGGFFDHQSELKAIIGDRATDPTNLFLKNFRTLESYALLLRVGGIDWHDHEHVYELRWCHSGINCGSNESIGDIDHGTVSASLTTQVPASELPVTFYNNNTGTTSTLKVDWVYVRLYRDPEPAASVGAEQGLVELGISMVDYPDPLRTGEELNYVLTIENNSVIDAPNVIVTDTLPDTVQLVGKDPGCYEHPSGVVVCNFNTIPGNSTINTTIVVSPYEDGLITNTVDVSSPGYELNSSNNVANEVSLVDSVPPVVNWVKPVTNGENYAISGGEVSLEASAYDNVDEVARVEFVLWDHISANWVTVGSDSTSPYHVPFDTDTLECQQIYQMYVIGVDRAGNRSNPYNPLQVIYLERSTCSVFLPLTVK
jgi:uncharacterized repeat protein (TIGR01451 family)